MPAKQSKSAIHYEIKPIDPAAHLFEVRLTVQKPSKTGQEFWLPAWIPGSYLIRDFARNIIQISATSRRKTVALTKLNKHCWQAAPVSGPITLVYQVYAWDMSVRGAHLDQTHGFFNGTSVFLAVRGQESQACTVKIIAPTGRAYGDWRVATTLPPAGAKVWQFGLYQAADYDELVDHPVEMGTFDTRGFQAGGARHEIVITGQHDADFDRLVADIKPICEAQIKMFEPGSKKAPMKRYLFLTSAVGDGYGGLEHRASTALICSRNDLPYTGMDSPTRWKKKLIASCCGYLKDSPLTTTICSCCAVA